jgi:cytochrome b involved in lipid metabolism
MEQIRSIKTVTVQSTFTLSEVAKHNKKNDCWIVIEGKVYDVSEWTHLHPGGETILEEAGKEATKAFQGNWCLH